MTSDNEITPVVEEMKTSDFCEGETDRVGRKVIQIYTQTKEYIVYRTDKGIKFYTPDNHLPPENRVHFDRYLKISAELGRIHSLQPEQLNRVESINKQIARGISLAVEDMIDPAKKILQECEKRLLSLRFLEGRLQYLIGSATLVIPIFILLLLGGLNINSTLSDTTGGWLIFCEVTTCGTLGGFLSVALGLRNLDVDVDADRTFNMVAGGSRIVISMVASVFVYFAVKTNIVLGTLGEIVGNSWKLWDLSSGNDSWV